MRFASALTRFLIPHAAIIPRELVQLIEILAARVIDGENATD